MCGLSSKKYIIESRKSHFNLEKWEEPVMWPLSHMTKFDINKSKSGYFYIYLIH